MESLALAFSSGWASGVNAYLVVLVLGIAERIDGSAQIPDELGSWEVLGVAALMYAFEFVADKVPYVDSVWDVISTRDPAVRRWRRRRPARRRLDRDQRPGGRHRSAALSALASHTVKAGTRLAVNTSPEPASNIAISIGEDVVVLALVWFAIEHPYIAAGIAGVLLLIGLAVLYFAIRADPRGWRRLQAWRARRKARRETHHLT